MDPSLSTALAALVLAVAGLIGAQTAWIAGLARIRDLQLRAAVHAATRHRAEAAAYSAGYEAGWIARQSGARHSSDPPGRDHDRPGDEL